MTSPQPKQTPEPSDSSQSSPQPEIEQSKINGPPTKLPPLLVDTWWFGLTKRMPPELFKELGERRSAQGFTAVQLVVGIPPEVGPANPNAASDVGAAWQSNGTINHAYLALARQRIKTLNDMGFTVIVYGGWGHQLDWIGVEAMRSWWQKIIETLDDLDVQYCLGGELNLWIGSANKLLPDRSTNNLKDKKILGAFNVPVIGPIFFRLARVVKRLIVDPLNQSLLNNNYVEQKQARIDGWSDILASVAQQTQRPIFAHPAPPETSHELVNNTALLAAVTVQTGHDIGMKNRLWQWPLDVHTESYIGSFGEGTNGAQNFINLEPWYEGILSQFGSADQLYAYWATMLAGASAYCYGAHGIWNVGDGEFLAHWGRQTIAQAAALETGDLLGASHALFVKSGAHRWPNRPLPPGDSASTEAAAGISAQSADGQLIELCKSNGKEYLAFYPEIAHATAVRAGQYFVPLIGKFVEKQPISGPVVVVHFGKKP
mgnify:CR=1 FL=1